MFLIGIFGVETKSKVVGSRQNIICPLCHAYGRYEVIKTYDYFHVFFIPVWKWNERYYIRAYCCGEMRELKRETGVRLEQGEVVEIRQEDFVQQEGQAYQNQCPHCGARMDPGFQYCPYCGQRR